MHNLNCTLALVAEQNPLLHVAGRRIGGRQVVRMIDHKATALLAAGYGPYDSGPVFDGTLSGVIATLAALSIGLRPSHQSRPPHRREPASFTLAEARCSLTWRPRLIPVRRTSRPRHIRDRAKLSEAAIDLLAQLEQYAPSPPPLQQNPSIEWPPPGLREGPATVPERCVAVEMWACEYDCCGKPIRIGQRVAWRIWPARPSEGGCTSEWLPRSFHETDPAIRTLRGVVRSITLLRERIERVPWGTPGTNGMEHTPEGQRVGLRRTGAYAHRELSFYPCSPWRGDLVVGVEPI